MELHPARPRLEVADIFRLHGNEYRNRYPPWAAQLKVMNHIEKCRTAALGGHIDYCDNRDCDYTRISYNSCRDRHCPKCQNLEKAKWLQKRLERLLSVLYFHVVFTLPDLLNTLVLYNKRLLFDLLFEAASKTLVKIAADKEHLGAEIGFTAILHSWGQNLLFHPHLHCVVTGGGLDKSGKHWIKARPKFFLPVKVLGRMYRGKFIDGLKKARKDCKLDFSGNEGELAEEKAWKKFIDALYKKDWVVYSKPPFGGAEQVFRYLGRYTHRVAISNHRLIRLEDGRVTFQVKDYADSSKKKEMTIEAVEFIRRFLLHLLPKGYTRIRHYGLFAGKNVNTKLEDARRILEPKTQKTDAEQNRDNPQTPIPWWERLLKLTGVDVMACPRCDTGRLIRLPLAKPDSFPNSPILPVEVMILDSS
jgi:hypothetical protein